MIGKGCKGNTEEQKTRFADELTITAMKLPGDGAISFSVAIEGIAPNDWAVSS